VVAFLSTDNKAVGEKAGKFIVSKIGNGKVAIIEGKAGNTSGDARRDGANIAFKAGGNQVVASLPADAGILKATFAEYLSMTPDARMEFARFGGRMAKSDFEKLSPAAKTSFCVNGGKILEDRTFVKSPSGSLGRWE